MIPKDMARAHFKKYKTVIWLTVIVVGVAFLAKGCFLKPHKSLVPPRPVQIALALEKDVPIYVDSFGNLTPPYDVSIKSQVSGQIKEVHFNDGQDVKEGDPLFTIDPSEYRAQLEKAEAALSQDIIDLKLKKDTLERNKSLVKTNLISQQEFEKCQTDAAGAEAKVKLDRANVDLAQINLKYCSITSPINGRTGKRQVDPGNIVTANSGPTLVTVKSIDSLYVDFTIPERSLPEVRASMSEGKLKVEISVEGEEDATHSGEVVFIDNTVDNTTGTVSLRAVVNNEKRTLWPGQFVNVRLILGMTGNAVLVPYESVQLGQKGPYLFVATPEDTADLRLAKTGDRQDNLIVIKEGVKAGERVVVSGQMGLSKGAPVIDISHMNQLSGMKKPGSADRKRQK